MTSPSRSRTEKPSPARERLLTTASSLFYAEGIGSVGVGRIVDEGHVTLATLYRHFPSKQDLVVAYLQRVHDLIASRLDAAASTSSGRDLVLSIADGVTEELALPGFRGCAFLNAASEYEDAASPVRRVIAEHRGWYYELVRRALDEAGHPLPGSAARHFVLIRDGAMCAAYLEDDGAAARAFRRGVEGLLLSIDQERHVAPDPDDDLQQSAAAR
ncbi:MAG: TetR/AcrR family transcriptional regulator [Solirubrobacteraceae bacterium]|nr:TetR/AcrR family transcriptional regulator [Patulibacter sp.]